MKISFTIHYQTRWGQQVAISGNTSALGNGDINKALRLTFQGNGFWGADLQLNGDLPSALEYKYVLLDDQAGRPETEWGEARRLETSRIPEEGLLISDAWRIKGHPEHALYTSAFVDVIFRPGKFSSSKPRRSSRSPLLQLRLRAPRIPAGMQFCVVGSTEELGNWDLSRPLLLGNEEFPLWTGTVLLKSGLALEYKYGIYDPAQGKAVQLETGENRRLPLGWMDRHQEMMVTDEYFQHADGLWHGTGVAIPVFSLRTNRGLGAGEFSDLREMVDWAAAVGLKMVQILPVNDTSATHTWVDSYPYAAISVFALHPLFLNVEDLGQPLAGPEERLLLESRERLNKLPEVDYEEVMSLKLRLARSVFDSVRASWLASSAFKNFFKDHKHWLQPYAAFCYLRDRFGTADFSQWGEDAVFSEARLRKLTDSKSAHYPEIAFHYFLQFHLDRQLAEAANYARGRGIILKGDIPIGIYRHSVDAWVEPELYNMDGQAGAPPDPFSETGQNWGFPTYNWQAMARDGYRWWQQRLQQLSRYFDAFRIDHILGFFRIWEIPIEQVEGLMGRFNPALPVTLEEFEQRGIPFQYDRFCKPHIPEQNLYRQFGDEAHYVRETFLESDRPYHYRFRPEFDSQRKLEAFFQLPENQSRVHLKKALFDLIANLLFFEEPGSQGRAFHPRIMMEDTQSYQDLNPEIQARLRDLYLNYFFRRQDEFWRQQAMTKLPAIKEATNMLICGEDLGMVPESVPGVMKELDILSLEIQRMSKNPKTEFLSESDIPYLSVCSPSTHDMPPIRAWWEEMSYEQRRRFYQQQIGLAGEPPFFCEPFVVERILAQHLYWPSMWAVFPLQDLIAMDGQLRRENPQEERINIPAIPKHYWRYRMHLSLEELQEKEGFNSYLRQMIRRSGR